MSAGENSELDLNTMRKEVEGLRASVKYNMKKKQDIIATGPGDDPQGFDNSVTFINVLIAEEMAGIRIINNRIKLSEKNLNSQAELFADRLINADQSQSSASSGANLSSANPPLLAEAISRLMTKPKLIECVLGSREEQFRRIASDRGIQVANLFYWIDTAKSSWPALMGLIRWTIAGDFLRRWLGS